METGAITLTDPQHGDGSFSAGEDASTDPVPGGLTPTCTDQQTTAIAEADTPIERLDPQSDIDPDQFPIIHRLAHQLAEEHFTEEFDHALQDLLDRIAAHLS
jgi:TetR/AcrR family transcriptional regulator, tetracycline repressor protein